MKTLVVTGIEAFGDYSVNPSQDVANALSGSTINDFRVQGMPIPYDSRGIERNLLEPLDDINPDLVVLMGQSFTAEPVFQLERIARNHVDYAVEDLRDSTGYRPETGKIIVGAPEVLQTGVSVDDLLSGIEDPRVVASDSAGENYCNEIYFHTLHRGNYPALFLHLPPYPEQTGQGGLPFTEQVRLVEQILSVLTDSV